MVGVVDTGIDSTHDDLENIIYRGSPHNLTTTLHRDFTNGTTAGASILNPSDPNGHGTHVAGIIGAEVDNSLGISGVSRNVSLVSLRVLNSKGAGELTWSINAINYAASVNIPILNCSFGSPSTTSAFQEAVENYEGLLVCAAGNDDNNTDIKPNYPSSYSSDNIISVGATDSNDNRSNWNGFYNLWGLFGLISTKSNYGATTVDLFAPGTDILSTIPGNKYEEKSGTSMATPFVTGAAAVLLSINSELTTSQLKNALLEGAEYRSSLSGLCVSEGRLNVYNSLKYIFEHYSENSYTLSNYSGSVNTNKTIVNGNSYFNEKNGFYKLNVTYAKNYEFNISSNKDLNIILYDENFNEISYSDLDSSNQKNHMIKYLSIGTYYLRVSYASESDSGVINTKIISRNTAYLSTGENNVLINTYNGDNVYYYINNSGPGFYKFSLIATKVDGTSVTYPAEAILIKDHMNQEQEYKYNVLGYSELAETDYGINSMHMYLQRNGYYYVHITMPTGNYSDIKLIVTRDNTMNIDVASRCNQEFTEELFSEDEVEDFAMGFTINQTSKFKLNVTTSSSYSQNITLVLFKKGYNSTTSSYYKVDILGGYLPTTNETIILDEGTYYIGYFGNTNGVTITATLERLLDLSGITTQVLVMDPGYTHTFGTEVRHNNGAHGGNTITEGFTRHIHFNNISGVPSLSRYDYSFYSSNTSYATVSIHGTVFAKAVTGNKTVTITAVYKYNPSIIFTKELTIVDDTSNEEKVIETTQTIHLSDFVNGLYQVKLDETNSAYPWFQYYNWSLYCPSQENDIIVTMDLYGRITTTGAGYATLTGTYTVNPNVTIIIHLYIQP